MLKHVQYKIILRKLRRQKTYMVINIVGLAIAFTATLLISNHFVTEWSMDQFHVNAKNIYRVTNWYKNEDVSEWEGINTFLLGPSARQEIPGIVNYARVLEGNYGIKMNETEEYSPMTRFFFVDASLFQMFDYPLVQGCIDSTDINWVVVSRRYAHRNYGKENPIGKTVWIKEMGDENDTGVEARIVAVMEDIPDNTCLQADIFIDSRAIKNSFINEWGCLSTCTFLQLGPLADVPLIEKMLPELIERHYPHIIAKDHVYQLQPLTDVYFHSGHISHDNSLLTGQMSLSILLYGISLLILVLAIGNYMMIKTAQINRELTGMAIQKCFGADNRTINEQQILETGIHTLCALLLSIALAYLIQPYIIDVISPEHPYGFSLSIQKCMWFFSLVFVSMGTTGLLLNLYTQRKLNRHGLKNVLSVSPRHWDIKKILTVLQITIFTTLLFCAIVISRQMSYMQHKDLGFSHENVLHFYWPDRGLKFEAFKQELSRNPAILHVSNGTTLPTSYSPAKVYTSDKNIMAQLILADPDFIDTYQLRLSEGRAIDMRSYSRNFDEFFRFQPEKVREVVVNRSLVKALQLEHPLDTILTLWGHEHLIKIVGVIDDFQYLQLYQYSKPAILIYDIHQLSSTFIVRYQPGEYRNVYRFIQERFQEQFPNSRFECDEYNFSELYHKDLATVKLIIIFALTAILIGGMGIFAFSTFIAESKTREVALRKVNGATEWQIVQLFNRQFLAKVLVACAISLPVAYYASRKWLEGYAYKTEIGAWLFMLVVLVSAIFVLSITSWQTRRAARKNPIDTIKTE